MTAESSRKPSTEPERSPVENARLLLPQLTAGQRAVVGALIAECERLKGDPIVNVYAYNSADLNGMVLDFRADLAIARETAEYHGERYAECKEELARVRAQLAEVTRERDEARRAASDATDGPWFWQDTDNDLDSMSDSMVISITAGRLKQWVSSHYESGKRHGTEEEAQRRDAELDRIAAARAKASDDPHGPWTAAGWEWRKDAGGRGWALVRKEWPRGKAPAAIAFPGHWEAFDRCVWTADAKRISGVASDRPSADKNKLAAWTALADRGWPLDFPVTAPEDAASDDPHGLGEGWIKSRSDPDRWTHPLGACIAYVQHAGKGMWDWYTPKDGWSNVYQSTAREAAAIALGKPVATEAREIDWGAVRKAGGQMSTMCETQDVVRMLRALVDELRRTGELGGGK